MNGKKDCGMLLRQINNALEKRCSGHPFHDLAAALYLKMVSKYQRGQET